MGQMLVDKLRSGKWLIIVSVIISTALISSCTPITIGPSTPSNNAPTNTDVSPNAAEYPSNPADRPSTPVTTDLATLLDADPAGFDNSGLPITPTDQLHTTGFAPEVNITQYRLQIDGLVDTPLSLSYQEILDYPAVTQIVLLICPGYFADNAQWTGVKVADLLKEAGIKPEAKKVSFYEIGDGYSSVLTIDQALKDGVFLAYDVNGEVLPTEHGYPLRLVAKGQYGSKWVKWVGHIKVE